MRELHPRLRLEMVGEVAVCPGPRARARGALRRARRAPRPPAVDRRPGGIVEVLVGEAVEHEMVDVAPVADRPRKPGPGGHVAA